MDAPESAADPRDGEPYYIDNECPNCGTELVLYQEWEDEDYEDDEIWHDEWWCPGCENGIHMDWPEAHREEVFCRIDEAIEEIENGETTSLDDLEEALGLDE